MPDYILYFAYSSAIMTVLMAVMGYFAVLSESRFILESFVSLKIFQFCCVCLVVLYMIINLVRFDNLSGFGANPYIDDNWPRIMKLIDMV